MMQAWVISMWAIAGLMGCWSFSLLARWVSEAFARKRTHLRAKRTRRSFWLGFVLIFVCLGVSLFAGAMAVYLENQFNSYGTRWTTPVSIIGGSACLFAACLVIWAWIGDRARGQLRCPKCWYDMSATAGLQCPECGRTAKSEAVFSKAKRPRWAFTAALVLLVSGGYAISVNKRVAEYGPLAAVPTWFLMMGWEHLPDNWIYDNGNGSIYGCLEDRLDDGFVKNRTFLRFGKNLSERMLTDYSVRWDPKLCSLVWSIQSDRSKRWSSEFDQGEWNRAPIDADELLRVATSDLLDAFEKQTISPPEKQMFSNDFHTPFDIAIQWISDREEAHGNDLYEPAGHFKQNISPVLVETLTDLMPRLLSDSFKSCLVDKDLFKSYAALDLAEYAGVLDEHADILIQAGNSPEILSMHRRATHLSIAYEYMSESQRDIFFNKLQRFASSESSEERHFAVYVWFYIQRLYMINHPSIPESFRKSESYHTLIDSIRAHCLDDSQNPYPQRHKSIQYYAIAIIDWYDPGQPRIYERIRELLLKQEPTPRTSHHFAPELLGQSMKTWLNYFADLSDSPDDSVREWVIRSIPMETGSIHDDAINSLIMSFLSDSNSELRQAAFYKLRRRNAGHLIPESDD